MLDCLRPRRLMRRAVVSRVVAIIASFTLAGLLFTPTVVKEIQKAKDDDEIGPRVCLPERLYWHSEAPKPGYGVDASFRRPPPQGTFDVAAYARKYDSITADTPVVLFADPIGGFSNRLFGLFTALVIAVLADRPLLVDWDFPPVFALISPNLGGKVDDFQRMRWANHPSLASRPSSLMSEPNRCYFNSTCGQYCPLLSSTPVPELYHLEKQVMRVETNCPLYLQIVRNRENVRRLIELGVYAVEGASPDDAHTRPNFVGFHVFGLLYRRMFRLADHMVPAFESVRTQIAAADLSIGIQIRMGGPRFKDPRWLTMDDLDLFWDCADAIARAHYRNASVPAGQKIRWFIATDTPEAREAAIARFGDRVVTSGADVVLTHMAPERHFDPKGLGPIVLDQFLLGECDYVLLSRHSTFGEPGAMRAGKIPFKPTFCGSPKCARMLVGYFDSDDYN